MCAIQVPGTFMMERDFGKARVMRQGYDEEEDVRIAMDVCPVSCIDFVSWDDLVALEMERLNTSVDTTFNWVKTDGNLLFSADVNAKANKNF